MKPIKSALTLLFMITAMVSRAGVYIYYASDHHSANRCNTSLNSQNDDVSTTPTVLIFAIGRESDKGRGKLPHHR